MRPWRHVCAVLLVLAPLGNEAQAQPVTQAAGGGIHSLFLRSDSSFWGMGGNVGGALGYSRLGPTNVPIRILASNVVSIAAGNCHTLFLTGNGSLWGMGANSFGELGDGTYNPMVFSPELIIPSNVVVIAAAGAGDAFGYSSPGDAYSVFVKSDGSLWSMGNIPGLQLGIWGTNTPQQIVESNVAAVATAPGHILFLDTDGSLWGMGGNYYGETGPGTNRITYPPQEIVSNHVTAIAAGENFSLFLESDGSLWGMGYNSSGQLGDGTYNTATLPEQITASNVTAVATGWKHSLFLKSDGSLWAMGDNFYGELGDGTLNNTNLPEQIVASNVVAIAAGGRHSLFIKSDGSLWAMGDNYLGKLGDGTNVSTNRPVEVVSIPSTYNQLSIQYLAESNVSVTLMGNAWSGWALEQSSNLSPSEWISVITNTTDANGILVFTNVVGSSTNCFWRTRFTLP